MSLFSNPTQTHLISIPMLHHSLSPSPTTLPMTSRQYSTVARLDTITNTSYGGNCCQSQKTPGSHFPISQLCSMSSLNVSIIIIPIPHVPTLLISIKAIMIHLLLITLLPLLLFRSLCPLHPPSPCPCLLRLPLLSSLLLLLILHRPSPYIRD
jgi:hypothetical protein